MPFAPPRPVLKLRPLTPRAMPESRYTFSRRTLTPECEERRWTHARPQSRASSPSLAQRSLSYCSSCHLPFHSSSHPPFPICPRRLKSWLLEKTTPLGASSNSGVSSLETRRVSSAQTPAARSLADDENSVGVELDCSGTLAETQPPTAENGSGCGDAKSPAFTPSTPCPATHATEEADHTPPQTSQRDDDFRARLESLEHQLAEEFARRQALEARFNAHSNILHELKAAFGNLAREFPFHQAKVHTLESLMARMEDDIAVVLNQAMPIDRIPTPPDPVRPRVDLASRFPGLASMVFDGTLPADSLEPPFMVVYPGARRDLHVRPAGSFGGMKAAHKLAARGSSTPHGDAPDAIEASRAGSVLPTADSSHLIEAEPVHSTSLLSPPPSPGETSVGRLTTLNGSGEEARVGEASELCVPGVATPDHADDPEPEWPVVTPETLQLSTIAASFDESLQAQSDAFADDLTLPQLTDKPLDTRPISTEPILSPPSHVLTPHLAETSPLPGRSMSHTLRAASPPLAPPRLQQDKPQRRRSVIRKAQAKPSLLPAHGATLDLTPAASTGPTPRRKSPPSPVASQSSSIEYLGGATPGPSSNTGLERIDSSKSAKSSAPVKPSAPAESSAPAKASAHAKPATHASMTSSKPSAPKPARMRANSSVPTTSRLVRQASSRHAARRARVALSQMVKNPFPSPIAEERPRKRRRTEREHSIPSRLERLLAMSDGNRYDREGVWPPFPKGWKSWRMLKVCWPSKPTLTAKQEIRCDRVSAP